MKWQMPEKRGIKWQIIEKRGMKWQITEKRGLKRHLKVVQRAPLVGESLLDVCIKSRHF